MESLTEVRLLTFYATFGMGHGFREYYAEIQATDWQDAQDQMTDCFGQKWSNIYREDELETKIQAYDKRKGFVLKREPNGLTLGLPVVQPEYEP